MTLFHTHIDPQIPFLNETLDLWQAQTHLKAAIPTLRAVESAAIVRHKQGRRAIVAYQVETAEGSLSLLGKIRAKGTHWNSYYIQQNLWNQGFGADSADGFSVPEPIGVIPTWHMCLQRKVPGTLFTDILPTPVGILLAQRIASLAHKLHRTSLWLPKTHTLIDELRILQERLAHVADCHPHWRSRLSHLLANCQSLITSTPTVFTSIHRDFYSDQILVDKTKEHRLWLLDLDLCCYGDPALDIGNFIAHITEQSLREQGNPEALGDRETALHQAFLTANDLPEPDAIALSQRITLYTALTLVRHIEISTRIPARRPYTEAILELSERRLEALLNTKV